MLAHINYVTEPGGVINSVAVASDDLRSALKSLIDSGYAVIDVWQNGKRVNKLRDNPESPWFWELADIDTFVGGN